MKSILMLVVLFTSSVPAVEVKKGQYASLYMSKGKNTTVVHLKNMRKFDIYCKWGIDGHYLADILKEGQVTKDFQFYNNEYSYINVSWRCKKLEVV